MPNVEAALDTIFLELSKEYDIEEVNSIPCLEHLPQKRIWKVQIPALLSGKALDIETYIRFP